MAVFHVIRTEDPSPYREQILRFWEMYLPGTPPVRYEWMREGNPAGPAVWFVALEEGRDEIAGTMTILPRVMYRGGAPLRAGILGDFMIDAKYRVFGPNLRIMRAAVDSMNEVGCSFLYTVPNEASMKVAERVGIREITPLSCYARPIDMRHYLSRALPESLSAILAPAADLVLRLSSRETHGRGSGTIEEIAEIDSSFDRLQERVLERFHGLMGDRSAAYLRWRYSRNPLYDFRVIVCRRPGRSDPDGYLVFCEREENKIEIYDIVALDAPCRDALMREMISIARAERRQAVYLTASMRSEMLDWCSTYRFIDTKKTLPLYCYGSPGFPLEEWEFTSGDRNI